MEIKIVGKGCNDYFKMLQEVNRIADSRKGSIQVIEVTDNFAIAKMGLKTLPALIVDGKVCCQGVGIKIEEIRKRLEV